MHRFHNSKSGTEFPKSGFLMHLTLCLASHQKIRKQSGTLTQFLILSYLRERLAMTKFPTQLRASSGVSPDSPRAALQLLSSYSIKLLDNHYLLRNSYLYLIISNDYLISSCKLYYITFHISTINDIPIGNFNYFL